MIRCLSANIRRKLPRISISRYGIYAVFRTADATRPALGFVIKPARCRFFSERYTDAWPRSLLIGPIYVRTFYRCLASLPPKENDHV